MVQTGRTRTRYCSGPRGLGLLIRHFGLGTPPTPLPLTEAAAAVPVLQRANWIMSRWFSIEWRAGADLQSVGTRERFLNQIA